MATVNESDDERVEDAALCRAIDDGAATPDVQRQKVFEFLESVELNEDRST